MSWDSLSIIDEAEQELRELGVKSQNAIDYIIGLIDLNEYCYKYQGFNYEHQLQLKDAIEKHIENDFRYGYDNGKYNYENLREDFSEKLLDELRYI